MKRIYLIIIGMVLSCVAVNAAQLTPAQIKAKKEIYSALKNYGTNITDGGEESISFKYNGATYEASVHTLNQRPREKLNFETPIKCFFKNFL